MARVVFEGFTMDARTRDMLEATREICWAPLAITQGAYNSSVAASGGTHDGGGVIDIRATTLTAAQRVEAVASLRKIGFAAWLRTPAQSDWPYHIHCVAVGCPDLSLAAKAQVVDYKNGRNGLASHGPDDGPRNWVTVTWEYRKAHPLPPKDGLTVALANEILAAVNKLQADFDLQQTVATGRFNQEVNETRSLVASLRTLILAEDVDDDATEDGRSTLAGQRWSQTQDTVVAALSKLDALAKLVTPVEPPAPKA